MNADVREIENRKREKRDLITWKCNKRKIGDENLWTLNTGQNDWSGSNIRQIKVLSCYLKKAIYPWI